ncbi:MAG: sulfurtransferase TusA family protein [Nitrososphaerales archaeon]
MSKDRFKIEKISEGLYRLDVRGLVCPYPQLLVTRSLNNLSQKDLLEVILNNPPSVRDIPPILEERGYKVDVIRLDSTTWKMLIQKRE